MRLHAVNNPISIYDPELVVLDTISHPGPESKILLERRFIFWGRREYIPENFNCLPDTQ